MAIRKVYGGLACAATMHVLVTMFEYGLDFEFISVDLKAGDHTKDSFLSLRVTSHHFVSSLFSFFYI